MTTNRLLPPSRPSELSNTPDNYPSESPNLADQFKLADSLRDAIDAAKTRDASLWSTIVDRLRTDWTYHSNGIEGSTLTRGETHFFLSEGLTVEGKPFKDFLDAKNHAEAIDILFEVFIDKNPISESFIKEINALLLQGVKSTPAVNAMGQMTQKMATPGAYKALPNHVQRLDGSIHFYVEPIHVKSEMEVLVRWVNDSIQAVHPIHVAAVAHYNLVRIHPFDDGNGRGARILMNLILLKGGYFPAVIRLETKRKYLEALNQANQGNLAPFIGFIADTVIATKQSVLDALQNRPSNG